MPTFNNMIFSDKNDLHSLKAHKREEGWLKFQAMPEILTTPPPFRSPCMGY